MVCIKCGHTISAAAWWSEELCLTCLTEKKQKQAKKEGLKNFNIALIGASRQLLFQQEVWLVYVDCGWEGIGAEFKLFATEDLADIYIKENDPGHGYNFEKQKLGIAVGKVKEIQKN